MLKWMKLVDKFAKMNLQELEAMYNNTCNTCVAKHMGKVYCDTHVCNFEKLISEEINFRKEMISYVKS